jgi:uncharacterized protein YbcC (UPF0753/DUF2309 family)
MNTQHTGLFNEHHTLHGLKHFLPAQAPLKDFIHHNTLHAFQDKKFHKAVHEASKIFGYKTYLQLDEYREMYGAGKISDEILNGIITERKGASHAAHWKENLAEKKYNTGIHARIGMLRREWKRHYKINLSKEVHPILLRTIVSYLDQGVAIWGFPIHDKGFLNSLREIERNSFNGLFKTERAKKLLQQKHCSVESLLKILVEDESLFENYLFDQQFEHPGWSGMVSVLEDNPQTLLDRKQITLHDFIAFELLLEIDALDNKFGENWSPLGLRIEYKPRPLFAEVKESELFDVLAIWQEAYEWTYYDKVLAAIQHDSKKTIVGQKSFQAMFCIDDRECSIRRYLEKFDPNCSTYGTAGFFNVEFYFQPEDGKFSTKVCPQPLTPKHLIKEENKKSKRKKDAHFTKYSNSLVRGWLITQTLGFWSAIKLLISIFRPAISPATSYSFHHMDKDATLTIENKNPEHKEHGLQVGFTLEEMADRVEGLLKSIGLVKDFAPLIYIVGHGASSVNNTYYAGYDCGACSGRPGSVNARVATFMANHKKVREILAGRNIQLPESTQFVGALHDTTRDEIEYFDEDILSAENKLLHEKNKKTFLKALNYNSKERARRFVMMDNKTSPEKIHEKVKLRSVSLFEPRPEYNHATNTLCIVGRRELNNHLFLDRRSFLNSFNYKVDPEGKYLLNILKAVAPVCGGINLEYYFSRTDNHKLGSGSKLPHNVMGLIGVANGADGDLRPGLPLQMIEIHDPMRLLVIVEHFPEVVLKVIPQNEATYEWFKNEWIHLIAVHPETKAFYQFKSGEFILYQPKAQNVKSVNNLEQIIETEKENIEPLVLN